MARNVFLNTKGFLPEKFTSVFNKGLTLTFHQPSPSYPEEFQLPFSVKKMIFHL